MKRSVGYGHVFTDDPSKKEEMVQLRKAGYSLTDIARKYGVDHTTIIYHCRAAGIKAGDIHTKKGMKRLVPTAPKQKDVRQKLWRLDGNGEWVRRGMTDTERKQAQLSRKRQKLEQKRIEMLTY